MNQTLSADYILQHAKQTRKEGVWERAMEDILYFIEVYVPKKLFDVNLASKQQLKFLKDVQNGQQYFAIRAPRKGGKTILVAIAIIWITLKDQTYRWFVSSGSENQAHWLYDYCKQILWPRDEEKRAQFAEFLKNEPKATITEFKKGGFIMYAAASSKSVNAPTADGLAMDEFVLIPKSIVQEAWPMIRSSTKPRRMLLSTATDGKENTDAFIDILDDCEPGKPLYKEGWKKYEWETKDSPHLLTDAAKRDSRSARYFLSEDMYRTQYEGGIPKRAGRIFPRTFIREAFVALDPKNPGFLVDGSPYTPEDLSSTPPKILPFQGEGGGGIDWGFDHDTVIHEGYRGLDKKIHLMKVIVGAGTSPSDWAKQVEDDSLRYHIDDWYADAAGAFQNQEIRNKGFRVTSRAFQERARGKEWMIGVAYYWLSRRMVVIPDDPNSPGIQKLKKQLEKWVRDADGKPKKGDDDCNDSFIVWLSKWDPRFYGEEASGPPVEPAPKGYFEEEGNSASLTGSNDWNSFSGEEDAWMPSNWGNRGEELKREPWEV